MVDVPVKQIVKSSARQSRWIISADLGQTNDYTAITMIQIPPMSVDPRTGDVAYELHVRHMERLALGTPYPEQVRHIGRLCRHPKITMAHKQNPALVVDATGVGRPICDLFREAGLNPCAITITGGKVITKDTNQFGYNVPKRDLITNLLRMLQTKKLKVARNLPTARLLIQELLTLKLKITAKGNDTYEHWRQSDKDDLALSLAIGVWFATYVYVGGGFIPMDSTELDQGEVELPEEHTGSYS